MGRRERDREWGEEKETEYEEKRKRQRQRMVRRERDRGWGEKKGASAVKGKLRRKVGRYQLVRRNQGGGGILWILIYNMSDIVDFLF